MNPPTFDHPFEANRLNTAGDFLPEWDVPSLGGPVTDALARDVDAVRRHPAPDPARKIHLLGGPAGYGKTHLFGRLRHDQGDRVQFVFVPAPPDPARATGYVCWRVVEALFHSAGGTFAPVRRHLAAVLRPSFAAYLDQLPAGLRAKCTEVRQALAEDPMAVIEVITPVTDLAPYHVLADSIRTRMPELSGPVVRALVLGLSPAADDARAWLRGEADQIPDERLHALRLDDRSPDPADVLKAVATLLGRVNTPLVLCLDQLDLLYVGSPAGFRDLTGALMGWLQDVPNLVVVMGAVDEQWRTILGEGKPGSFVHRVHTHKLVALTPAEAREVVVRRMRTWDEFDPARGDGWPFDLASVEKFAQKLPTPPRGFIDRCKLAFDEWRAGGRKGLITLDPGGKDDTPLPELFLQEWNAMLAATRQGLKAAADYQDAELWAGVEHALRVAQAGQYVPDGVRFERYQLQALKKTPSDPRPSAELHVGAGGQRHGVVLAVSKKDSGAAFSAWYKALEESLGGTVAGAVVVWPKGKLSVGKTAKAYQDYQARVEAGAVRPFPLDDNEDTFAHLECLRKLMADAQAGMVQLGGKALTPDDCRKLLVETKALAGLKLFDILFHNWPAVEAVRVKAAPAGASAATQHTSAPAAATSTPVQAAATKPQPSPVAVKTSVPPPPPPPPAPAAGHAWADQMLAKVADKLRAKGQPVKPVGAEVGPTFVRLKVEPKDDTDFAKVKRQADNLKLLLGLAVKPVIGNQAGYISIDVVRPDRQPVPLPPLLDTRPPDLAGAAAFPLGVDVAGRPHWLSLSEPATCHLLVAGTTGSGKSQLLKSLIAALCDHLPPDAVRFALVDPKQVTFTFRGDSPYLLRPVEFDAAGALPLVEQCYEEMERRYALLRARGKEHVGELAPADAVPRWVVVFDEFADLMLGDKGTKKELEALLKRLGAKARAAGIHLVLGTQRPEASVVTPLLRANLPGRISLQVATERESKLILDEPDAAHLLDKGDLLWRRGGSLVRLQGPLVAKDDLERYLRLH